MKLDVSDKTGGFGRKPLIKKGYYPAQLIKVEKFVDKEGNLREGKYGNQLILSFAIYKPGDKDEPTKIMTFIDDSLSVEIESDVMIPKFVYYTYKDSKTGELNSALTPNSAITRVFTALGWKFDATKQLDINDFVNNWVEVNVDDYEAKDRDGNVFAASTIKDINKYKGPEPKVGNKNPTVSSDDEEIDMSQI